MAQHACEMVQRERKTLCSAKQLLTKLRGDETWIPCGLLCSEHDDVMFNTEKFYNSTGSKRTFPKSSGFITQDTMACGTVNGNILSKTREGSKGQPELDTVNRKTNTKRENLAVSRAADSSEVGTNGTTRSSAPTELNDGNSLTEGQRDIETAEPIDREAAAQSPNPENPQTPVKRLQDTVGTEISTMDQAHVQDTGNISNSFCQIAEVSGDDSGGIVKIVSTMNGNTETKNAASVRSQDDDPSSRRTPLDVEADKDQPLEDGAGDNDETQPPPRRMRTRAQVQAASEPTITPRTESPDLWVPPNIHPLFMIPNEAIPDHDFGLPPNEAEETRRMIILYVQKQEEVCRGAEKLYEGLLQADRQRKTVLKWCKAEGHVGEMSDGEDW